MRVLILAYDFPPFVSVGGLRPYSWLRYLPEYGVEAVVVTRQWANEFGDERDYVAPSATDRIEIERTDHGTVVRTPYRPILSHRLLLQHGTRKHRVVRKLITAWYEFGQYYADIGPKAPIYGAARDYARRHPVDAIVATGNPFVLFRYASRLSRELGVPWIADFRDPWSQDKRRIGYRTTLSWATRVERRWVASASMITTVAESVRDLLVRVHPGKPVAVILNGYDPEAMAAADGIDQDPRRLTLAFTGTVYGWHPVESVFGQLDAFNAEGPRAPIHLRMVGVGGRECLEDMLRTRFPALESRTSFTERLPNDRMAAELARANAFLMFNNYAYPGTKIYDYLALRRRILLCYADDPEAAELKRLHYNIEPAPGADERVLDRIVGATASGVIVKDASHLRKVLGDLEREFLAAGSVACASRDIERYSRRTQAGLLADVLKGLRR